jgi:hypothetical protein
MCINRVLGAVILIGGVWVIYHASTTLIGWQHRNKARLGIDDYGPYLELAFGLCVSIIGVWLLLRRRAR